MRGQVDDCSCVVIAGGGEGIGAGGSGGVAGGGGGGGAGGGEGGDGRLYAKQRLEPSAR